MSFVGADPYTAVALAAQRRAQFLAEATHARQLNQLPSGRHETRVSRFVLAVRGDARSGVARVTSWGAVGWRHQVSMFGEW